METMETTVERWETLNRVSPADLVTARETLHWAAQVPGAAGNSLLPPQPDDGHTTLRWDPAGRRLATGPGAGFRVALVIEDLALQLLDDGDAEASRLSLDGRTLDDAFTWLGRAIEELTGAPPAADLIRRDYDLPTHPVATGAPFVGGAAEPRAELARWYANGARVLDAVVAGHPGASQVRCWPHHFDLATLITLDAGGDADAGVDAESARSLGVGLSPGDAGTPQPYWYITPWPYPDATGLPALAGGGRWNTEGWVGALLTASEITGTDAGAQARQVTDFVRSATAAALRLLGEE
jgi:hypothetical protein